MINKLFIQNFKSIVDTSLELGNFNVLIGENGSGKSNILEAIAFGAAASANKLDFEFLGSRGIRIVNSDKMVSRFIKNSIQIPINISFESTDKNSGNYRFLLYNDPSNNKKWINLEKEVRGKEVMETIETLILSKDDEKRKKAIDKISSKISEEKRDTLSQIIDAANEISERLKLFKDDDNNSIIKSMLHNSVDRQYSNSVISNFIIYSPEESSLRKFEDTTQIYPLGIRGEGLFQYLKELFKDNKNKKLLKEVKENLLMLDWFEDFEVPDNSLSMDFSLKIKDKFLYEDLEFFDQRSTNEGFLFLLFYSILFSSPETPQFFAIDNIDTGFNPKLCVKLIQALSKLAKKHNKQVILTTHNPAVLDGLNLKDKSQRLFVINRNMDGFTTVKRVPYKKERKMKLSEVWTGGFIGGLPDNF